MNKFQDFLQEFPRISMLLNQDIGHVINYDIEQCIMA